MASLGWFHAQGLLAREGKFAIIMFSSETRMVLNFARVATVVLCRTSTTAPESLQAE